MKLSFRFSSWSTIIIRYVFVIRYYLFDLKWFFILIILRRGLVIIR